MCYSKSTFWLYLLKEGSNKHFLWNLEFLHQELCNEEMFSFITGCPTPQVCVKKCPNATTSLYACLKLGLIDCQGKLHNAGGGFSWINWA